jgi:hypothetical protein
LVPSSNVVNTEPERSLPGVIGPNRKLFCLKSILIRLLAARAEASSKGNSGSNGKKSHDSKPKPSSRLPTEK